MIADISQEAELDLADGYWFYESQEKELGSKFRDSLKLDLESFEISEGPTRENTVCNCKTCTKFPFAIFYRMDSESQLTIVAVFSQRRGKE